MELDSTNEDTVHNRLYHVFDQMINMIPPEMRDHPMAKMLVAFTREGKKDIKRLPSEFIEALCRPLGIAFTWVAEGSLDDLEENQVMEPEFPIDTVNV